MAFIVGFHDALLFKAVNQLETELKTAALAMLEVFEELCGALRALPCGADPANAVKTVKNALAFPKLLLTYLTVYKEWNAVVLENHRYSLEHTLAELAHVQDFLDEDDLDTQAFRQHFWEEELRLIGQFMKGSYAPARKTVLCKRGRELTKSLASGKAGHNSLYEEYTKPRSGAATDHELMKNPEFRIDPVTRYMGSNSTCAKIQRKLRLQYFELIEYDLSLKWPHHQRVLIMLKDLRDGVASIEKCLERNVTIVLQKRDSVAGVKKFLPENSIHEVLDMVLIQQQLQHGVEWTSCVKLMHDVNSILERLEGFVALLARNPAGGPRCCKSQGLRGPACPQARGKGPCHPDAKEHWEGVKDTMINAVSRTDQVHAFCKGLMFLLDRMGELRMKTTNSRLHYLAQRPRSEGISNLRAHFQDSLEKNRTSVERTNKWLRETVKMVLDGTLGTPPHREKEEGTTIIAVVYLAIANLVSGPEPPNMEQLPETLSYDLARIRKLNAVFHAIVSVLSVLAHVVYIFPDMSNDALATLVNTLAEKVLAAPAGKDMAVVDAVEEALQRLKPNSASNRNWVTNAIQPNNGVLILIHDRLHKLLWLSDAEVVEMFRDVNTTCTAYNKLQLPPATQLLTNHILTMVLELHKVRKLNVEVHLERYKNIIQEEGEKLVQAKRARGESANPSEGSEPPSKKRRKQ